MQNKVRLISSELAEARNGAEDRLLSMENTVEVVRDNIDSVINRQASSSSQQGGQQQQNIHRLGSAINSTGGSVGNSSGGSPAKKRSETAVAGGKQDPLQSMYNHLQTR